MDKIIVSIIAVIIILILILASHLWYWLCVISTGEDILYVMRMSRGRMVIGIPSVIFSLIMTVVPIIFLDAQMFVVFVTFYLFLLLSMYFCIMIRLWRCVIREDSLTFYTPLLPAKEIKFYEIDFVHYTDNHTLGLSGQKTLVGYSGGKKLFSIEEDIYGFPLLCALLCERGKADYVPAMENPTAEKTLHRVPVVENFTVTAKTEEKIRAVLPDLFLLLPCFVYILCNRTEFELIYQIIAIALLPPLLWDTICKLMQKVTVDFRTISVRNSLGFAKTYEIRQITEVVELEHYIVLYIGSKKIAKIAKDSKNFQYLFERLLRTEAEIYRKF